MNNSTIQKITNQISTTKQLSDKEWNNIYKEVYDLLNQITNELKQSNNSKQWIEVQFENIAWIFSILKQSNKQSLSKYIIPFIKKIGFILNELFKSMNSIGSEAILFEYFLGFIQSIQISSELQQNVELFDNITSITILVTKKIKRSNNLPLLYQNIQLYSSQSICSEKICVLSYLFYDHSMDFSSSFTSFSFSCPVTNLILLEYLNSSTTGMKQTKQIFKDKIHQQNFQSNPWSQIQTLLFQPLITSTTSSSSKPTVLTFLQSILQLESSVYQIKENMNNCYSPKFFDPWILKTPKQYQCFEDYLSGFLVIKGYLLWIKTWYQQNHHSKQSTPNNNALQISSIYSMLLSCCQLFQDYLHQLISWNEHTDNNNSNNKNIDPYFSYLFTSSLICYQELMIYLPSFGYLNKQIDLTHTMLTIYSTHTKVCNDHNINNNHVLIWEILTLCPILWYQITNQSQIQEIIHTLTSVTSNQCLGYQSVQFLLSTYQLIHHLSTLSSTSSATSSPSYLILLSDYQQLFQQCIQEIKESKSFTSYLTSNQLIYVQSWLYLLYGKILSMYYSYHTEAFHHIKEGLSNSLLIDMTLSMDNSMLQCEGYLFLVELYDKIGKLSKCYDYLAHTQHICDTTLLSSFINRHFFCSLHIFHRANSSKLNEFCQKFMNSATQHLQELTNLPIDDITLATINSLHQLQSLYSLPIQTSMLLSQCQLTNGSSTKKKSTKSTTTTTQSSLINLEILHLLTQFCQQRWGQTISNQNQQSASSTSSTSLYIQYLSPFVLYDYQTLISLLDQPSSSSNYQSIVELYAKLSSSHGVYFEVIKVIRKKIAKYIMENNSNLSNNSFDAFAFGISACFPSLQLEYSSQKKTTCFTSTGESIQQTLLSSIPSIETQDNIQQHLQKFLQQDFLPSFSSTSSSTSSGSSSSPSINNNINTNNNNRIVYLTYEKSSQSILCGCLTSQSYETQIISFDSIHNNKLHQLLQSWATIYQRNNQSLHHDYTLEQLQTLTDKDRLKWWKEREDIDQTIQYLLQDMEQLLTPINHFFQPFSSSSQQKPPHSQPLNQNNNNKKQSQGKIGKKLFRDEEDDVIQTNRAISPTEENNNNENMDYLSSLLDTLDFENGSSSPSSTLPTYSSQESPSHNTVTISSDSTSSASSSSNDLVDYESYKIVDLRTLCKERMLPTNGRKADMISRLITYDQEHSSSSTSSSSILQTTSTNNPPTTSIKPKKSIQTIIPMKETKDCHENDGIVILILDEFLQSFPLENIPSLRHQSCTRIPSLSLLIDLYHQHCQDSMKNSLKTYGNPSKTWYALDIDNNLPQTRQDMSNYLTKYIDKWLWKGFIGCIPSEEEINQLLSQFDYYIFCGHGAGDKVFVSKAKETCHRPAAFLWGCSSGYLIPYGVYDPMGSVLTQLQNNAPFVVGNLWDVTDKDLDKLSKECMDKYFDHCCSSNSENENKSNNLMTTQKPSKSKKQTLSLMNPEIANDRMKGNHIAKALIESRDICKMKYAVGSAAIVYGLPLIASVGSN